MRGVVEFLLENPRPSDEEIHQWAEDNGHTPEEVEEYIYEMLSAILRKLTKSTNVSESDFDPKELKRGIEVEMEHTDSKDIAKMIAMDHLKEMPNFYYTLLDRMEKEGKKLEKVKLRAEARLCGVKSVNIKQKVRHGLADT